MKQNLKILIVDDHKIYRDSLKMTLKRLFANSKITEAENGREFLDLMTVNTFDIVLMDIKMPVMDGLTATKIAIKQNPELKILGISMYQNEDYCKQFKDYGAKGFIQKGGDFEDIKFAIEEVLYGRKYFMET